MTLLPVVRYDRQEMVNSKKEQAYLPSSAKANLKKKKCCFHGFTIKNKLIKRSQLQNRWNLWMAHEPSVHYNLGTNHHQHTLQSWKLQLLFCFTHIQHVLITVAMITTKSAMLPPATGSQNSNRKVAKENQFLSSFVLYKDSSRTMFQRLLLNSQPIEPRDPTAHGLHLSPNN